MPRRSLREYERKRSFASTPEPRAAPADAGAAADRPRFVVHEHHASSLHWDLRLERDGVLVSWAVPKGIPQDPKRNHLAVHVEDHPLDYIDFAGEIPAGEYGTGTVSIWDSGTYEAEKFHDDEVILSFDGERLQGKYALFQTDGRRWLIHRMDPPAGGAFEPPPEDLRPMLARLADRVPEGEGWGYELKWDGVRALVRVYGGRVSITSRTGRDITRTYPELRGLGPALGSRAALLDGEVVAFDDEGRPSFQRLQARMNLASDSAVRRARETVPAAFMAFDLLHLEGRSLLDEPYSERRHLLEGLELEGEAWRTPEAHLGDPEPLLELIRRQGLEGLVAKRLDSRYEPGRRSSAWLKVKNRMRQEVVIGGFTPGTGSRGTTLGALLVGVWDRTRAAAEASGEPQRLLYAGKVGTGFDAAELDRLLDLLRPLERSDSPFSGRQPARGARLVEPRLACDVEFAEWTRSGTLRAPAYKGLVTDRDVRDVVREEPIPPDAAETETPRRAARSRAKASNDPAQVEIEGRRVRLSNLDKVLYPAAGFTKGQVIDYYSRVAPALLPHLAGRPLTLKRYPDGVEGKFFFEKNCPKHRPDWVRTVPVPTGKRTIDFCVVDDLATLVWVANLASLELHPSLSLADDLEHPTLLAFDLDPGAPAALLECCEIALALREVLAAVGLESFPKTTGKKGIHVYAPLDGSASYEETKPFARTVAELLESERPKQVVSRQMKTLRKGRVLVDWSQNDRHKTTGAVYSLRAAERPTVSAPLAWEEVEEAISKGSADALVFEADAMLPRVAREGDLFAPVAELRQSLPDLA